MRKYFGIIVVLVTSIVFVLWLVIKLGVAQSDGPDGITLENSYGKVTFNHSSHKDVSCTECHHMGMDNTTCKGCHSAESEINTMNAFHKNCIECHKEKKLGPSACTDCHKK